MEAQELVVVADLAFIVAVQIARQRGVPSDGCQNCNALSSLPGPREPSLRAESPATLNFARGLAGL